MLVWVFARHISSIYLHLHENGIKRTRFLENDQSFVWYSALWKENWKSKEHRSWKSDKQGLVVWTLDEYGGVSNVIEIYN